MFVVMFFPNFSAIFHVATFALSMELIRMFILIEKVTFWLCNGAFCAYFHTVNYIAEYHHQLVTCSNIVSPIPYIQIKFWRCGGVVTRKSAKLYMPVRFWSAPPLDLFSFAKQFMYCKSEMCYILEHYGKDYIYLWPHLKELTLLET